MRWWRQRSRAARRASPAAAPGRLRGVLLLRGEVGDEVADEVLLLRGEVEDKVADEVGEAVAGGKSRR